MKDMSFIVLLSSIHSNIFYLSHSNLLFQVYQAVSLKCVTAPVLFAIFRFCHDLLRAKSLARSSREIRVGACSVGTRVSPWNVNHPVRLQGHLARLGSGARGHQ